MHLQICMKWIMNSVLFSRKRKRVCCGIVYFWYILYVFVFATAYNEKPVVQLGVGCGLVECHLVANDDRDLISISAEPD